VGVGVGHVWDCLGDGGWQGKPNTASTPARRIMGAEEGRCVWDKFVKLGGADGEFGMEDMELGKEQVHKAGCGRWGAWHRGHGTWQGGSGWLGLGRGSWPWWGVGRWPGVG